ncbi:disease resistance protein Roq1-like isoform X2 [Malus sylvestris]|uniref:disease resistance protein Roq1-like isoform X2 n=1 Tax=Malus sylvestris TaxID=3752 RepID=UPI0021ABF37F|nr:disease resistance protein Roq1-like isoform X2 [Malus sylvestris]
MTAHEASSSSSSTSKLWKYDVFLSFRGEDTRYGFTSHLHAALTARGYQVFIDEDDLPRGEEIKEKLFRAIEESRISVIIFSKMYGDSSWCLDELVKIMECRDKLGRHVLPIFYHADPSHVRKQDGDLAEAFQKHEKDIREEKDDKKREAKQERVNQWREALTKAANLSGHHLQSANNRREAEFIKKIINENICEWLTSTNELRVAKHIVGIDSRVQDIITYLSSGGSNDVLMVGIWGMGGLVKTTVAKAIYNQIHPKFEFKSFLAGIRDATSKHDLVDLQKKLIFDILKKKPEISCVDEGIDLIKQQFRHRKILVIVDNIDKEEQLNAIVGSHDWFGPGSRIIITTRVERLLQDRISNLQDRISNLPHEILVLIVSLLPLKEAAATSILSRPWRHVWAFTTTLSFDAVNFEVGDTLHRFLDLEEQVRDRESRLYVNWVDHVLDQHRGQCIDRFRVCFFLQRDFAGSIDKWIQFAMEKRVQILELELLTDSIVFLDDNYTFPHKLLLGPEEQKGLFSNLPSLHPGGYSIAPFESLRVVRFQHVGVTGETLEFLLSNCPVLERLSLSFAKDLVKLRVTGTSMALKYLEVKYCLELSIIEISGANIVSFIYCGQLIDLRLNNVPLLVEVSIYKWGTFAEFVRLALSQLSCCLSHLETLKLDIRGAVYNQNHAFPALSNLKHLELLVDADYSLSLGRLASFMEAAPYLLNLVLGLGFSTSNEDMEIPEKVSKQPHHFLKLVEIAGYRGHECCVEHVRYLVENAVALEKIIINPVRFWCRPTGIESNALLENEEENARDHAIQHLKKKVPSSVEFVCL